MTVVMAQVAHRARTLTTLKTEQLRNSLRVSLAIPPRRVLGHSRGWRSAIGERRRHKLVQRGWCNTFMTLETVIAEVLIAVFAVPGYTTPWWQLHVQLRTNITSWGVVTIIVQRCAVLLNLEQRINVEVLRKILRRRNRPYQCVWCTLYIIYLIIRYYSRGINIMIQTFFLCGE